MEVSATGESRIEATHRLQREGRWGEASKYRDEVRKQGRSEGKKRHEASEAAWEAMLEKFPPLIGEAVEDADPAELAALAARSAGQHPDVPGDTLWVYWHLSDDDVTPLDAPSLGAWWMLRSARENHQWFFGKLLPKAMNARMKSVDSPS